MRLTRAMATLALALALIPAATAQTESAPPNIVFILLDDAGWGDFSSFGQAKFQTPAIDALARDGLRMTAHYAGTTVCAPSRCSLMTGRHTGHAAIRGNGRGEPFGQEPLPAGEVTIGERLKEAGYATGCFGKWGLGAPGNEGAALLQGFDRFYGYYCQSEAHLYYPPRLHDGEREIKLDGTQYAHDLIMEQGLEFIRGNSRKPFLCMLTVTIPHAAMQVPEAYAGRFREAFNLYEGVEGKYDGTTIMNPAAAFAGMMTKIDEDIGRVRALLEELGIDRRTLVVISSDNGPHHEGGHDPQLFDSNGPWRGFKRDLYEGGIRVPTIAWWPGTIAAGRISDEATAFWDWMPTFCELAGSAPPEGIDGLSLVPTLRGEGGQARHDYLYWEFHEQGGKQAVRKGDWKAVRLGVNVDRAAPVELYDLANDPGELFDRAAAEPDVAAEMARIMDAARTGNKVFRFKWEK